MKRILILALALILLLTILALPAMADKPEDKPCKCTTIQDGTLLASDGDVITVGYDEWGYNYQAHMFNGFYENNTRPAIPVTEGTWLMMKWSDIWLSNKDCNGDGILDRGGPGGTSSDAEGAWLTNHQSGWNDDGSRWTYFVKIVAAPADAYVDGGYWYTADGVEIGSVIWGAYARILQISNDPGADEHGLLYKSPASPGFGYYTSREAYFLLSEGG